MSNHFHIGRSDLKKFLLITVSTLIVVCGTHFFKFPNNFSFGGVTGYAVVLAEFLQFSVSTINFVISMALIVIGFIFLGRSFGALTAYSSVLVSVGLSLSILRRSMVCQAPFFKKTAGGGRRAPGAGYAFILSERAANCKRVLEISPPRPQNRGENSR